MNRGESLSSSSKFKIEAPNVIGSIGIALISFGIGAWVHWQAGVTVLGVLLFALAIYAGRAR